MTRCVKLRDVGVAQSGIRKGAFAALRGGGGATLPSQLAGCLGTVAPC